MDPTKDRPEGRRAIARASNRLLRAVDELKALEVDRRQETISTPPFHRLADDVKSKSREIFRMASDQEALADRTPTQDRTIVETDLEEPRRETLPPTQSPIAPSA
jgi:hypothetical protein